MRTKTMFYLACLAMILCLQGAYGAGLDDDDAAKVGTASSYASKFVSAVNVFTKAVGANAIVMESGSAAGNTLNVVKIGAKTLDAYNKKGGASAVYTLVKTTTSTLAGRAAQTAVVAFFVPAGTVLPPLSALGVVIVATPVKEGVNYAVDTTFDKTSELIEFGLDKTSEGIEFGLEAPFEPVDKVEGMSGGTPDINNPGSKDAPYGGNPLDPLPAVVPPPRASIGMPTISSLEIDLPPNLQGGGWDPKVEPEEQEEDNSGDETVAAPILDQEEDNSGDEAVAAPILQKVTPIKVMVTGSKDFGGWHSEYTLTFWNVGSLAPGYEGASLKETLTTDKDIIHKSHNGRFSGGPNGIIILDGQYIYTLVNGSSMDAGYGVTMTVNNPEAFKNWPEGF